MANDFITAFQAGLQPLPKKKLIVNPTIQHSIELAHAAQGDGWWPQTYAPANLDLVRWKLGKFWNNNGEMDWDQFEPRGPLWEKISVVSETTCPNTICAPDEKKEILKVGRGHSTFGLNPGDSPDPAVIANAAAAWLWILDSTQNIYYTHHDITTRHAPNFGHEQGISVFGNPNVGVRGKVFYDHVCELEVPHEKRNAMFSAARLVWADVNPTYNFYAGSYECIIDDPDVDERILPNIYAFLLVEQQGFGDDVIINNDATSVDNIFEKNVTLNGIISGTLFATNQKGTALDNVSNTLSDLRNKGEKLGKASSKGQYFDKFADKYRGFNTASSTNEAYRDKLTNLIVPITDLDLYKNFNDKRFNFPMCVDINFSTDVRTKFAEALKDSKLSSAFIKNSFFVPELPEDAIEKVRGPIPNVDPDWFSSSAGWKVPENAGLILWVGDKNETQFDPNSGFKIHIARSGVKLSAPGIMIDTNSLYLGDKVEIVNWSDAWHDGAENVTVISREHSDSSDPFGLWEVEDEQSTPTVFITAIYAALATHTNVAISTVLSALAPWKNWLISKNWEMHIIGYWNNWRPSSSYEILNWGGDPRLTPDETNAASDKDNRYDMWQAYSFFAREKELLEDLYLDVFEFPSGEQPTITNSNLKQWDITKWIQKLAANPEGSFNTSDDEKITYLGAYNEEIGDATAANNTRFFRTLMTVIFAGKFSKMAKFTTEPGGKVRTFEDILNGDKAYSETAFYKIEKWALNNSNEWSGDEPIQTICLPNSNEIDVHRYIDTQVKYNKRYGYKIFAYQVVFGTRYRYVLDTVPVGPAGVTPTDYNPTNSVGAGEARICVFTAPSIRLIKVPYYEFKGIVMDSPPIWPDVNILPYLKQNNKVLFLLQGAVGNYKLMPINILEEDRVDVQKLQLAQKQIFLDYKSDDHARTFEIFRMTTPPITYQDFSNWKLGNVTAPLSDYPQPQKSATSAGFVDDILPNVKYYYMFRSVDVHDHVSNPSPVYEVEIVDSGGAPTLLTRIHPLVREKEPPQKPAKCAKKYIYITPNPVHVQLNRRASGLIDESTGQKVTNLPASNNWAPVLGVAEETVWGKKFKIRIVSKETGKKIDLKLEFKTEHEPATDQGDLGGQKIC